jgi:spermidine/putrescine-binding protein
VKLFIAQDLAEPLQHELLPNRHHLEERFQNPPYDPNNRYSIPYFWGTTGIGYNRKKVGEAITSWAALSDPRWKRKINLFDDMREVLGIPFHLMNEPLNTRDPQVLEKARKALLAQKEIVRTYNSSTYKEILNAGDVWLTQGFSGDVLQLRKENPDIEFVNPKEGGTIFVDNMMIPKSSRKKVDAHTFINFILRPEIGAKLSGTLGFATPSKTAHELLPEEVRNDPAVYPPQEVMEKLEYISDVGPALSQYEDIWMDLKTH